jgi:hypothetical protein
MDVDASVALESSGRETGWLRGAGLFVAGVWLGLGLAYLAVRLRGLRADATDRPGREPALADLTRDELYERAQAAEIPGRSGMSKDDLIDALRAET